jgi:ferredoxin-thioredoxin reductase catalytic subunit
LDSLEKNVLERSEKYAKMKGFALNGDEKVLGLVVAGLARNERENGFAYCPCRALTGDKKADAKNICPCSFHLDEIAKDGHCRCRLFFSKK